VEKAKAFLNATKFDSGYAKKRGKSYQSRIRKSKTLNKFGILDMPPARGGPRPLPDPLTVATLVVALEVPKTGTELVEAVTGIMNAPLESVTPDDEIIRRAEGGTTAQRDRAIAAARDWLEIVTCDFNNGEAPAFGPWLAGLIEPQTAAEIDALRAQIARHDGVLDARIELVMGDPTATITARCAFTDMATGVTIEAERVAHFRHRLELDFNEIKARRAAARDAYERQKIDRHLAKKWPRLIGELALDDLLTIGRMAGARDGTE